MKNRKRNGTRTEPWGRPWANHRLELKTLNSWTRARNQWGKDRSSGWRSEECQCLAYGAVAFLSRQYRMLCWSQVMSIRSVSLVVARIHFQSLELFEWSDLRSSGLYENPLEIGWTCCWFQQYNIDDWLKYVPEVWLHMMWDRWDGEKKTSHGGFPALSSGMIVATLQIRGQWASENEELNMDNKSWRARGLSGLRKEGGILSVPAAPLPFIFLIADCNLLIRSGAQLIINRWHLTTFFEISVSVTVGLWHIELADPGVVVSEGVSFGFNISDGSTVVGHSFTRRVCIWCTVKTLDNFPHVRTIWIGHRVLEKGFPTLCFCLVDRLVSLATGVYPLLAILMDRLMDAISVADFSWHMWIDPRFWFLAGFRFTDGSSSCRD